MTGTTIDAFRQAVREAGIEPPAEIVPDGTLHRFHVAGDRRGDRNGWYILHDDTSVAGAFGCWKRGITRKWCGTDLTHLTQAARRAMSARIDAAVTRATKDRERQQVACKAKAARLWCASRPAISKHEYIRAKGIAPHGLRVNRQGQLLIPVLDGWELVGLQLIGPDGSKRFLPGTPVAGNYATIGRPDGEIVYVCEGYATGATIHEATGGAVAVAFNARNLGAVSQRLRGMFPGKALVLCADDDMETTGNPGLTNATEAARAVGGVLAVPSFANLDGNPTDFNDLHQREGIEAVRLCLERGRSV